MTQLVTWGWMHHLARHSVACFLTRGDLYVSWERGMEVFEEHLIDQVGVQQGVCVRVRVCVCVCVSVCVWHCFTRGLLSQDEYTRKLPSSNRWCVTEP